MKTDQRSKGDMERTQNSRVNPMTLTLSLHSRVIGSAQRLTEINIWVKINENRFKGYRRYGTDTKFKVKHMTWNCSLALESV